MFKRMFRQGFLWRLLALTGLLLGGPVQAVTLEYAASDLPDLVAGQDRWSYQYQLSGSFAPFAGVNLLYPAERYADLALTAPPDPAVWSTLITAPDTFVAGEESAAIRHVADGAAPPDGVRARGWGPATAALAPDAPMSLLSIAATIDQQVDWLVRTDPTYLVIYPSALDAVARTAPMIAALIHKAILLRIDWENRR